MLFQVASPGGSTICGIHELEKSGVRYVKYIQLISRRSNWFAFVLEFIISVMLMRASRVLIESCSGNLYLILE